MDADMAFQPGLRCGVRQPHRTCRAAAHCAVLFLDGIYLEMPAGVHPVP